MNPITFYNLQIVDNIRPIVEAFKERVLTDGGTFTDENQLYADLRATRYRDNIRLMMTPNAYKTSKIYSVVPNTASGDFTFARTSVGYKIGADLNWQQDLADIPRLDYRYGRNSWLFESFVVSRDIFYSQDFTNALWVKNNLTVTTNTTISPDGTLDADTITATADNGTVRQNQSTAVIVPYFSVFIKRISGSGNVIFSANHAEIEINPTSEWQRYEVKSFQLTATYTATGGNFTVTTASPHKLATNDYVSIQSPTGGEVVGIRQVTIIDATNFTYSNGSLTASGNMRVTGQTFELKILNNTDSFSVWQAQVLNTSSAESTINKNDAPNLFYAPAINPVLDTQITLRNDVLSITDLDVNGISDTNEGVFFLEFQKNVSQGGTMLRFKNSSDVAVFDFRSSDLAAIINGQFSNQLLFRKLLQTGESLNCSTNRRLDFTNKMAVKYTPNSLKIFSNGVYFGELLFAVPENTLFKTIESSSLWLSLNKIIMYQPLTDAQCISLTI